MEDKRLEALYPSDSWGKEIKEVLNFVEKGQSVQLIGIPGVGRSNLLGLLSYNRNVRIKHLGEDEQVKYHFVLINFSEIKDKPLSEVIKFIFLSLIDSLRLRNILKDADAKKELETASSIFNNSLATGDSLVIFNALKRTVDFLCLEKDLSVILIFDRFEDYIPNVSQEFFANLRALRNRAKYKFSVVFSLKRPIEDILEPEIYFDFSEFLQGNTVYIQIYDKPSFEFRIKHLEEVDNRKIPEDVIKKVLNLTSGHGKLTRLCLEAWLQEISNSKSRAAGIASSDARQISNIQAENFLSNAKIQNSLLDMWNSFTPEESAFIRQLADSGETKQTAPDHLLNIGILADGKISIPLFAEFVKRIKPEEEKFVLSASKDEIKRGEVLFSNGLTALEFRLFKFLLENERKILSREEIINAVWGDLKSTQGVTEAAIDQLIFRLRKKIEQDLNNPKLIQTIKGRGISFSQ